MARTIRAAVQAGRPPPARLVEELLHSLSEFACCAQCGTPVERIDTDVFMHSCGHVFCKGNRDCWSKSGRVCSLRH
jgi:hypothetical protein